MSGEEIDSTCIMMATYNRLELTKRMLNSFFKTTSDPYRLIIVDNGSTDGTVEYLKDLKENCTALLDVHFNEKNLGIAVARNQGLKIANKYNTRWLSTVDNDVELPQNWLSKCIDIIKACPEFAIGVNMEGKVYPYMDRNEKLFQFKSAGNLGTACTVFSRQLHEQIGYFTTEFGLYGEEDADFFFRARQLGYQMGYLLEMGVHFGEGELDQGEYREFKTKRHNENYSPFIKTCHEYARKQRPLYIPFEWEAP